MILSSTKKQEKCIKAVLRECKLTPTEVDCIECHGTGTWGCQAGNPPCFLLVDTGDVLGAGGTFGGSGDKG